MDLTPEQQALKKALEELGVSAEQITKILKAVAASAKFATESYNNITKTLKEYHKEIKTGNISFKDLGQSLSATQKEINKLSDGAQKERAQKLLNLYAQKAYTDQLRSSTKDLASQSATLLATTYYDYLKNQVLTGVKGLLGDGSPIQVAADLQTAAIDSLSKGAQGFGDTIANVGKGLLVIPNIYAQVLGGLLSIGGSILSAGAREVAEIQKAKVQIISAELEKTYNSFKQATAAGALFAGGLTELRSTAIQAGLSQTEFSKIIAENSQILATFGGDVTLGAQKLAAVTAEFTKDNNKVRKQLLNLGISIEDQVQGTAEFMAMLQLTGSLRGKNEQQLAQETKEYLLNLKAISSFTGEEAKKAQARAREASMQAAVQARLQALGPEATKKFSALIEGLPPQFSKAAQQLLVFGTVVDQDANVALSQVPGFLDILTASLSEVSDQNTNLSTATENLQKRIIENQNSIRDQSLAASQYIGSASLASGQLTTVSEMLATLAQIGLKDFSKSTENTVKKASTAADTQDQLTSAVSESADRFQQLKLTLQEELTPALKSFAVEIPKIIEDLRDKLTALGLIESRKTAEYPLMAAGFGGSLGAEIGGGFGGIAYDSIAVVGEYADGGIASGPMAGYMAKLHGTEAVVPLPDGQTIPVNIDTAALSANTIVPMNNMSAQLQQLSTAMLGFISKTAEGTPPAVTDLTELKTVITELKDTARAQLEKHEQMIRHLQDQKDISERMLNNTY